MDFTPPPPLPRYSADTPEPVEQAEAVEVHEVHDELFEQSLIAADQAFIEQSRGGSGWWLLVSFALFILSRMGGFHVVGTSLLVGALVLHELGHLLGMKLFGYRDVKMFFIPFLGAAVSGRKHAAAAWQEIVVLLLGPLPGIVLALVLFLTLRPTDSQSPLYQAISILLSLNAIQLLPLMPLDGGRVMNLLIFRRHPALEVLFKLFAVGGLLLLALVFMSWVLAIVAIFILIGIPLGFKLGMRARRIKQEFPTISAEWNEQGVAEFHRLYQYAREVLPADQVPANIGKRMVMLHEVAAAQSPGFLATVFYLCFFAVSFFSAPVVGIVMVGDQQQLKAAALRRAEITVTVAEMHQELQQATAIEQGGNELTEEQRNEVKMRRSVAHFKLKQAIHAARQNLIVTRSREDQDQLLELGQLQKKHFAEPAPPAAANPPRVPEP